jgi:hypothetical protein
MSASQNSSSLLALLKIGDLTEALRFTSQPATIPNLTRAVLARGSTWSMPAAPRPLMVSKQLELCDDVSDRRRRDPDEWQYSRLIRPRHSGAGLRCAAHVSVDHSAYSTIVLSAEQIMETMRQLQAAGNSGK